MRARYEGRGGRGGGERERRFFQPRWCAWGLQPLARFVAGCPGVPIKNAVLHRVSRLVVWLWRWMPCPVLVSWSRERCWRRVDMLVSATSPAPRFRKAHCAVSQRRRVFLFGGVDDQVPPGADARSSGSKSSTYFNDMWSLNISKRAWRRFSVTGTPPSPRAYAAMARTGEK